MMGYHGYHHMRGGYGPGMGGYGPMMGGGYGPGMGAGFGPGQMMALRADADHDGTLTADEVKTFFDVNTVPVRVDAKLGSVVEKDADTLTVTLVSPDGTTTLRSFDLPRKIQTAVAPRGWRGERMARRGGWDADDMPGRGAMNFTPGRELTVDDVKARVERRISRWNSDTVKIGEIAEDRQGHHHRPDRHERRYRRADHGIRQEDRPSRLCPLNAPDSFVGTNWPPVSTGGIFLGALDESRYHRRTSFGGTR